MSDLEAEFRPDDFGIGRLFQRVRDGIIVADAASERIVLWNAWASHIFGYTEAEALELPLHALVPEVLRQQHREGLARYQETGHGKLLREDAGSVELPALHKDGHEIPVELTLTPVPERTPDGHRFALAIVRDSSERRAAEDARAQIREAELRRRQALQLNDDVVQGLVVAKMALETDDQAKTAEALEETLSRAQGIVSSLLSSLRGESLEPGDLLRGPQPAQPEDD